MALTRAHDRMVFGARTSVADFGAVGDGVTDDTAAIQAAFDAGSGVVFFPEGNYLISTAITVDGSRGGLDIYGAGLTKSRITCSGCSAFHFPNNGYYRTKVHDLFLQGNSTAGVAAFDWTTVGAVTQVIAGVECYHLSIANFEFGWTMENAQINFFRDLDIALVNDGAVFNVTPINGSGQQCNANRVHRLRATGVGEMIKCTLLGIGERAADWMFFECDVQLQGTSKPPFHIVDVQWVIDKCEFENSTAPNLIHLEATGASLSPNNTVIRDCTLIGATVPIRISKAVGAAQTPTYIDISGNKRGSGTFLDLEAGNQVHLVNNEGTVNNTGGRFVTEVAGRHSSGVFKAINRSGANDTVGVIAGALSGSGVLGKNLSGQGQFATAGTLAVAFGARAEPDTDYRVIVTGNVNETFWVTSKATSGFTINSSNASSTATVDWFIVR